MSEYERLHNAKDLIKQNINDNFIIEKLTELLIKQDLKDRQTGKKELISKVGAYQSLINFFKEIINE